MVCHDNEDVLRGIVGCVKQFAAPKSAIVCLCEGKKTLERDSTA